MTMTTNNEQPRISMTKTIRLNPDMVKELKSDDMNKYIALVIKGQLPEEAKIKDIKLTDDPNLLHVQYTVPAVIENQKEAIDQIVESESTPSMSFPAESTHNVGITSNDSFLKGMGWAKGNLPSEEEDVSFVLNKDGAVIESQKAGEYALIEPPVNPHATKIEFLSRIVTGMPPNTQKVWKRPEASMFSDLDLDAIVKKMKPSVEDMKSAPARDIMQALINNLGYDLDIDTERMERLTAKLVAEITEIKHDELLEDIDELTGEEEKDHVEDALDDMIQLLELVPGVAGVQVLMVDYPDTISILIRTTSEGYTDEELDDAPEHIDQILGNYRPRGLRDLEVIYNHKVIYHENE